MYVTFIYLFTCNTYTYIFLRLYIRWTWLYLFVCMRLYTWECIHIYTYIDVYAYAHVCRVCICMWWADAPKRVLGHCRLRCGNDAEEFERVRSRWDSASKQSPMAKICRKQHGPVSSAQPTLLSESSNVILQTNIWKRPCCRCPIFFFSALDEIIGARTVRFFLKHTTSMHFMATQNKQSAGIMVNGGVLISNLTLSASTHESTYVYEYAYLYVSWCTFSYL